MIEPLLHDPIDIVQESEFEKMTPVLPVSGRSVSLKLGSEGEEISVRDPDGNVEIRITLTAAGPVIKIQGQSRLELEAPGTVAVNCQEFKVEAEKKVELFSWDELSVNSRETHLRSSDYIWLNGGQVRMQCP